MSDALTIVSYDPSWPSRYSQERERLVAALGSLARRIEHNGSTSVPGLAAKPVIDIQISVHNLASIDRYRAPLQALGYVHVAHEDDAFCPFFHRPGVWPHAFHIHVVEAGGEEEVRALAFRDYLRDHAEVAAEYAAIKHRLAPGAREDSNAARERYAQAKGPFIERVIALARSQGYPRS